MKEVCCYGLNMDVGGNGQRVYVGGRYSRRERVEKEMFRGEIYCRGDIAEQGFSLHSPLRRQVGTISLAPFIFRKESWRMPVVVDA